MGRGAAPPVRSAATVRNRGRPPASLGRRMTIERPEPAYSNDEVGMLRSFLDHYRATVRMQASRAHRRPARPDAAAQRPDPRRDAQAPRLRRGLLALLQPGGRTSRPAVGHRPVGRRPRLGLAQRRRRPARRARRAARRARSRAPTRASTRCWPPTPTSAGSWRARGTRPGGRPRPCAGCWCTWSRSTPATPGTPT